MRGGTSIAVGLALVAALAAAAVPSAAQLPAPTLPVLPRPGQPAAPSPPPSANPAPGTPATAGDATSFRANAAHTGEAGEEAVWGPLRHVWTKLFAGSVNQPLLIGGRLLVNVSNSQSGPYGSRVVAFDVRNGRQLWERPTPGTYYTAPLAADGATVVSVNRDGVVRAFAIADGTPRWTVDLRESGFSYSGNVPLVAAGRVFVLMHGSAHAVAQLHALGVSDGARLWSRRVGVDPDRGLQALDARRVFVSNDCGDTLAVEQDSGAVAWSRQVSNATCFGSELALGDGRVFPGSRAGQTFDAQTGADRPGFPYPTPEALAGGLAFFGGKPTRAVSVADGAVRWTQGRYGGRHPLIVGPTVYVFDGAGSRLWGLDRTTGELLSGQGLPGSLGGESAGGSRPGSVAGAGRLVLAEGGALVAYESLLKPRPGGLDFGGTSFLVAPAPGRVGFVGGLHPGLRGRASGISLQLDPHPFGRFRTVGRRSVQADGTAYFDQVRITRNTRVRVSAIGVAARSSSSVAVAYPRFILRFRRLDQRHVLALVRLQAGPDFRMGGRRLVLYHGSARRKRYDLLGVGQLHQAGRGTAVASVRFTIPRALGVRDVTAYCIPRMPSLGYGENDAFQRRCGRRIIPL